MDKSEIIIIASVAAVVAIRAYQRYVKKNKTGSATKTPSPGSFPASEKDDDYEPYSKK